MNGAKILIDTNVIIYHLSGNKELELLLAGKQLYISLITYAEHLAKQLQHEEPAILKEYINSVQIIHTNNFICKIAADIKKIYKIKLPDELIAATCFFLNLLIITFDTDFFKIDNLKIIKPEIE